MVTEADRSTDTLRINALVDGELAPQGRAEMAARIAVDRDLARAHATIALLKASVAEIADSTPDTDLPPAPVPAKRPLRGALALGAGVGAAAVVAVLAIVLSGPAERQPVPAAARDAVVSLAALPATPVIPDLGAAGLALADVRVDRAGAVPALVASYAGPHGCRLDLRVWPAGRDAAQPGGAERHAWTVGDLVYELTAHGMPGWRFQLIAEGAERQTRSGSQPGGAAMLREARTGAPPCTG